MRRRRRRVLLTIVFVLVISGLLAVLGLGVLYRAFQRDLQAAHQRLADREREVVQTECGEKRPVGRATCQPRYAPRPFERRLEALGGESMYQHALVPTDGSTLAEVAFARVRHVLDPAGRVTVVEVNGDVAGTFDPSTRPRLCASAAQRPRSTPDEAGGALEQDGLTHGASGIRRASC